MANIADFHCTFDNAAGIGAELAKDLDLSFPDAYCHWETMARIALHVKNQKKAAFCELPFCHTLEAEAMGGIVNLGDETAGPRARAYSCETADDLLRLRAIDYESGRIHETLKACKYLHEKGEVPLLMMSGPFTILNVLIDAANVFRYMRKEPEKMQLVFDKIQKELLRFVAKAVDYGAAIISYADSAGSLRIVGPRYVEYMVGHFTAPFLKKAKEITDGKAILACCPKTSFALIGTDMAEWRDIPIEKPMPYMEAVLSVKEKLQIVGQMCVKNTGYTVQDAVKALALK